MFDRLTFDRLNEIKKYVRYGSPQCEFTVGVLFMWAKHEGYTVQIEDGVMIVRLNGGDGNRYYMPVGEGDVKQALDRLLEQENGTLELTCVSNGDFKKLSEYGFDCTAASDRNAADYVYSAEELSNLVGKKYHGKRNHINAFKERYPEYDFELTDRALHEVFAFIDEYYRERPYLVGIERDMVEDMLKSFSAMGMRLGVLSIDGRVVGISLGEVRDDMLYVHIEKALKEFDGAAEMINNQYVKSFGSKIAFVNREDDNGSEGLRTAKLSYHPAYLIEKQNVTVKKAK